MTTIMTAIIETIIKSSAILSITAIATLVLRRRSAALRHTVWAVGLFCSLAVPLFSTLLPAWHVRPARVEGSSTNVIATQSVTMGFGQSIVSTPAVVPATPGWLTPETGLLLVWMLGVTLVASLLLREAIRLARVAFGASTVEHTSWGELVWEVSQALRLSRHVRLIRNPAASVLGTWGAFRPRVILPRESESWSDNRMRVVLAHELAHVKRNDWLVQVIAEIARAIYWFNPLFAIACTHLRRESEHACDDAAMSLGGPLQMDGPTYASHVLDLARTLKHSAQPNAAALAMASTSNLERRLVGMLNPSLNRRVTSKRTLAVIVLLALALTLPLAAVSSQAPMPVEFTSPIQTVASSVVTASARVAQRTLPQTATVIATTRKAAEAVQPAAPQNQGGTLSGTVLDGTAAVIPGARVTMTAQSSGIIRRTVSNENGNFAFTELPPDSYSGTVDMADFRQGKFTYLVTDAGSVARLNITLPLGLTTVIVVSAKLPPGTAGPLIGTTPPKPLSATEAVQRDVAVAVASGAPAVNPAAVQRTPLRVGGDVQAGSLLFHPNPAYPPEARNMGIEGVVILSAVIAEDGQIRSLKIVSSSNSILETGVTDTIQTWKYKPTLLNGEPVEVVSTITVNFVLER